MCDVCNNESPGSEDVGVAAVPSAPVSVMWCQNCLRENAFPLFVVETWLFSAFDPRDPDALPMPDKRPEYPLAHWTTDMTVWLDGKYVTLLAAWPTLWEREKQSHEQEKEVR